MSKLHPNISIQWHITTKCNNRCRHCYMYDEATYEDERKNTLSYSDLLKVLNSFEDFEAKWGAGIRHFTVSGGDPLLRDDWKDFLSELKRRGKSFSILGNPETLTEERAAFLAGLGVTYVQMSLDGLEKTHDAIRSDGSFQRTVKALELLDRLHIDTNIMFTLFPYNKNELIPLMRYVAEKTPAGSFSFDVGCSIGNAAMSGQDFTADELRAVFSRYINEKERLQGKGCDKRFAEKPNLLKLIRFENKEFYPASTKESPVISGCYVGWTSACVLSDGTVLACRRMPLKIGKMPEQSFEEIFLGSELLKKFRRPEFLEKCGSCDFYQVCRGCPANVYGITGDPFAGNPFCFRDSLKIKTNEAGKIKAGPPLSTNYQEEFDFVASVFHTVVQNRLPEFIEDKDFQGVFLDLLSNPEEKAGFLAGPREYLKKRNRLLDDEQTVFLVSHFTLKPFKSRYREDLYSESRKKLEAVIFQKFMDTN